MRKHHDGLIINISSGAGRFSVPFCSMYSSTKFALEGLIEGIYFELKNLGIESILVQPGNFATGLQTKFATGSTTDVVESYGEIAQIPNKMAESMVAYFKSGQAPDPSLISKSILKLIETEKGKRPFRTVVDPTPMGTALEKANKDIETQSKEFIKAFGL
jgi:short-subunit dehydrogenase